MTEHATSTPAPPAENGRPSRLTEALIAAFRDAIAGGLTIERTCVHLSIHSGTWRRWRAQGESDIAEGIDSLHARLCAAVHEGRMAREREVLGLLLDAARGTTQRTVRTTTTTRWLRVQDDKGHWTYQQFTDTTTVEEERDVRDWRAGLALLERTMPEVYARVTRQWVSGPNEEPVVVETAESLRERLEADLDAICAQLAEGFDPQALLIPSPDGAESSDDRDAED